MTSGDQAYQAHILTNAIPRRVHYDASENRCWDEDGAREARVQAKGRMLSLRAWVEVLGLGWRGGEGVVI